VPATKDVKTVKEDMKPADVPISSGSQNAPNMTEDVIKRDEPGSILPTIVETPKAAAVGAAPKEAPKGEQTVVVDEKHSELKAEEPKKEGTTLDFPLSKFSSIYLMSFTKITY
jgi:hypothetical protein